MQYHYFLQPQQSGIEVGDCSSIRDPVELMASRTQEQLMNDTCVSAYELRLRQQLASGDAPARELKQALLALKGKLLGCRQTAPRDQARTQYAMVIEQLITELAPSVDH